MRIYSINYDTKNYKQLDLLIHYKEENENRKSIYKITSVVALSRPNFNLDRLNRPSRHTQFYLKFFIVYIAMTESRRIDTHNYHKYKYKNTGQSMRAYAADPAIVTDGCSIASIRHVIASHERL